MMSVPVEIEFLERMRIEEKCFLLMQPRFDVNDSQLCHKTEKRPAQINAECR
jgi:hypothetical protein